MLPSVSGAEMRGGRASLCKAHRLVDDDRVEIGDVDARLQDSGGNEDVRLAEAEVADARVEIDEARMCKVNPRRRWQDAAQLSLIHI